MDKVQEKLIRGSRRAAFAFSVLFWSGVLWLFSEAWPPLKGFIAALHTPKAAEESVNLVRAVHTEAPAWALMGALWIAKGLFTRFARGEALTAASGRSLSVIGGCFLASVLASGTLPSPPPGLSVPVFTMSQACSSEILLGCVGTTLILLGRAFSAAAAIKLEHDQIV
jgi:hypothetical protein